VLAPSLKRGKAAQSLGIQVRAGLDTGECKIRGDDIGGIGARASALVGSNDVLVSRTLRRPRDRVGAARISRAKGCARRIAAIRVGFSLTVASAHGAHPAAHAPRLLTAAPLRSARLSLRGPNPTIEIAHHIHILLVGIPARRQTGCRNWLLMHHRLFDNRPLHRPSRPWPRHRAHNCDDHRHNRDEHQDPDKRINSARNHEPCTFLLASAVLMHLTYPHDLSPKLAAPLAHSSLGIHRAVRFASTRGADRSSYVAKLGGDEPICALRICKDAPTKRGFPTWSCRGLSRAGATTVVSCVPASAQHDLNARIPL